MVLSRRKPGIALCMGEVKVAIRARPILKDMGQSLYRPFTVTITNKTQVEAAAICPVPLP